MPQPPNLPVFACTIGKVLCVLAYVIGLWCLLQTEQANLVSTGWWILGFLVVSHLFELVFYKGFLQQVKASGLDYLQVFAFGIFHSATLLPKTNA